MTQPNTHVTHVTGPARGFVPRCGKQQQNIPALQGKISTIYLISSTPSGVLIGSSPVILTNDVYSTSVKHKTTNGFDWPASAPSFWDINKISAAILLAINNLVAFLLAVANSTHA